MIQSKVHDSFAELIELDLITGQQRDTAQQHPESARFQAHVTDIGRVFAWMTVRGIVPDSTLAELFSRRKSPMTDTVYESRKEVIKAAETYVSHLMHALSHEALTVLLDELIITQDQFARAEAQLTSETAFASPTAALMWMMLGELLSDEEIAAISADIEVTRAFSTSHTRVAIVDQTSAMLKEVQEAAFRTAKKKYWQDLFPGPRWLWMMGFVAFFGYGIWGILGPDVAPACDAEEVQNSIGTSLLRARIDPSRFLHKFSSREDASAVPQSLRGLRQAGYAKMQNARGCLASLQSGDIEEPYAYTITPASDQKHRYKIAEASPEIVQARYAHIDARGEFGNRAEPVGRAALESAIRDGVNKFDESTGTPGGARLRKRASQEIHAELSNPEKDREITDLEPNGNCRELAAGIRYSCEVLMERNDPLLSALSGGGLSVVKGAFTIERDRADAPWHASEEFATQYVAAIRRARIKTLTARVSATNAAP